MREQKDYRQGNGNEWQRVSQFDFGSQTKLPDGSIALKFVNVGNAPLQINNRLTIHKRSEDDGVKDLMSLAQSSNVEAVWVYARSTGLWCNITKAQDVMFADNGMLLGMGVKGLDIDFSKLGSDIVHYHIHPRILEVSLVKQVMNASKEMQPDIELTRRHYNIAHIDFAILYMCLPSVKNGADVRTFVRLAQKAPHHLNKFNIVSTYGVTSFSLSSDQSKWNNVEKVYEETRDEVFSETLKEDDPSRFEAVLQSKIAAINKMAKGLFEIAFERRGCAVPERSVND